MDFLKEKIEKEIQEIRQQMLKMIQDFPRHQGIPAPRSQIQVWMPHIDVYETMDEYIILVDIAGIKPEELDLEVDDRVLKIKGRRTRPKILKATKVHEMEIDFGHFERYFRFPSSLDIRGANSSYCNGLLQINLPKKRTQETVIISLVEE